VGTMTAPQPVDHFPVSWQLHAACLNTDSDVFFPTSYNPFTLAAARRYCQVCVVADACLDYGTAIGAGEGIWGGVAPTQRRLAQVKARLASIR
jgi:WhiB family redox-sensing transcriptional regulator